MKMKKLLAFSLSCAFIIATANNVFAANQYQYVIKETTESSDTSDYVSGDGVYGKYRGTLNEGDYGKIELMKQITLWPDSSVDSFTVSSSKKTETNDYWMEGNQLYYVKVSGDSEDDDEVKGEVWNYLP